MTFGEVLACCSLVFCNSGVEYRYPIRGIDTQIQHWNLGIWVSIPAREGIGTPCITPGIDTGFRVPIPAACKQFLDPLEA
ncbi:hypothetical protein GQ457_10G014480 [Hibiscus cannabinus]